MNTTTTTTTIHIASILAVVLTVAFAPVIDAQTRGPSQYVDRRIPRLEQEIKMQDALAGYYNLARYVGLFKQRGLKGWQKSKVEHLEDLTGWVDRRQHLNAKQKQKMIADYNAALNDLKKAEAARKTALERLEAARKQLAEIRRQIEEINRPPAKKPEVKKSQPRPAPAPVLLEVVEMDLGIEFTTTRSNSSSRDCGESRNHDRRRSRNALSFGGGTRLDLGKLLGGSRNGDTPVFDGDDASGFSGWSTFEDDGSYETPSDARRLVGDTIGEGLWAFPKRDRIVPSLSGQPLRRDKDHPAAPIENPCDKIER